MQIKFKNNAGFTLVEILTAITLLLIFINGLMYLFTQSHSMIYNAGNKSRATLSSQNEIEENISQKSVTSPGSIVLHYTSDGNNKTTTISGGYSSVVSAENNQVSQVDTFIPLAPTVYVYILENTTKTAPLITDATQQNNKSLSIDCLQFLYDSGTCEFSIKDEDENIFDNSKWSLSVASTTLLNLTINEKPSPGTYKITIINTTENILITGSFSVI